MIFNYNGVEVYYEYHNRHLGMPVVFLHGWGRSGEDFNQIISFFPEKSFLTIDFPPFGKSQKIIENWNIFTYVSMVISLCEHLGIKQADFIGHSFGGRLLLILSTVKCSLVHSCIFVDSAGMKPRRSINYRIRLLNYKLCKKLGLSTKWQGSEDYKVLSPAMKETFKSIVNTHLEDYAKKVEAKTLIIYGSKDNQTPIYMAKRLHKLIKNSRLEFIKDGGHFSFLDCPLEFFCLVKDFYKEE